MEQWSVWIIVIIAAAFAARRIFRSLSGKKGGCDCAGCPADLRSKCESKDKD